MNPFIENLESRSFLSASPLSAGSPATFQTQSMVALAATTTIPNVLGTWKGTMSIPGVHSMSVVLTLSRESGRGVLSGVLTTPADPKIKVAVTGRVTAAGKVSITLGGTHKGGAINGSGAGRLRTSNTRITFAINFTQGGQTFPGTIVLRKV